MRIFSSHSEGLLTMDRASFDDILDNFYLPPRLKDYIEHVSIPT